VAGRGRTGGFSAIQNNSDLSQGPSLPFAAQSTESAGILMPLEFDGNRSRLP
jgi:hypothetical protein